MRKVSMTAGVFDCSTKEQFLDANIKALIEVRDSRLAKSIDINLLKKIMDEADELFGATKHKIEKR